MESVGDTSDVRARLLEEPETTSAMSSTSTPKKLSPSDRSPLLAKRKTPVRKVDHVNKLERKQSSGDLHSRLKTRKLLGVGETDDGDVHRSKLSQILGHSEQLYTRLPRGLRVWLLLLALLLTLNAGSSLLFGTHPLGSDIITGDAADHCRLPMRLYGSALLGFSLLHWGTLRSQDKNIIRLSLLASGVFYAIQLMVMSLMLLQYGILCEKAASCLAPRFVLSAVTFYYYRLLAD